MFKKSKLIIGIILLAIGGGLAPTGYFVNDYLKEQVYEGVPETLLKIQADAVPSLKVQIPVSATLELFSTIEDETLPELEEQLPFDATPDVLLELKTDMEDKIPGVINCTTAAFMILLTLTIINISDFVIASNILFNDPTFEYNFPFPPLSPTLKGVSNYTGVNMSYTMISRITLLMGGISIPGVGNVSGIIDDITLGTGVCN
jgi:hypothetical protein